MGTLFPRESLSGIIDVLLTDLRSLIRNLGKDGGLISPSVVELLLPWLLDQVASLGLELSREPYATGMGNRPRLALIDGAVLFNAGGDWQGPTTL